MLLNLGSGPQAAAGWVNIDRSPNVVLGRMPRLRRQLRRSGLLTDSHMAAWDPSIIRGDIRKLSFADCSIAAIYSSHTLEHLYFNEAQQVLDECYRVLVPDGLLRLALPDSAQWARELVEGLAAGTADSGRRFNERLLSFPLSRPRGVERIQRAFAGHVHR